MQDYQGKWLKNPKYILLNVADNIATITLNRPEKRNALSPDMLKELHAAMIEADDRTDVNVIVLQGEGKDFCSGYDLAGAYSGQADGSDGQPEYEYRDKANGFDDDSWNVEEQQNLTVVMFDLHTPVIAKIHGNCLAGGTDIAFHCDIVISSDEARIGFPASRANGTPPNQMWVYHMGPQWTKRLLFTGDTLSGRDAAKVGLVLDSVPADELDEFSNGLAARIAATDPELLSAHKRVTNMALELMGAKTMQRFAAESDARAHLSTGPRRTQFKKDMRESDLRTALKNRDAPYGDGKITLRAKA